MGYAPRWLATGGGTGLYVYRFFKKTPTSGLCPGATRTARSPGPKPGTGFCITVSSSCRIFLFTGLCAWERFIIILPSKAARSWRNGSGNPRCVLPSPIIRRSTIPLLRGWTSPAGGSPALIFIIPPWTNRGATVRLAQEGKIATKSYQWLEIEVNQPISPTVLKIRIINPGEKSALTLHPYPQGGTAPATATTHYRPGPLDRLANPGSQSDGGGPALSPGISGRSIELSNQWPGLWGRGPQLAVGPASHAESEAPGDRRAGNHRVL